MTKRTFRVGRAVGRVMRVRGFDISRELPDLLERAVAGQADLRRGFGRRFGVFVAGCAVEPGEVVVMVQMHSRRQRHLSAGGVAGAAFLHRHALDGWVGAGQDRFVGMTAFAGLHGRRLPATRRSFLCGGGGGIDRDKGCRHQRREGGEEAPAHRGGRPGDRAPPGSGAVLAQWHSTYPQLSSAAAFRPAIRPKVRQSA